MSIGKLHEVKERFLKVIKIYQDLKYKSGKDCLCLVSLELSLSNFSSVEHDKAIRRIKKYNFGEFSTIVSAQPHIALGSHLDKK